MQFRRIAACLAVVTTIAIMPARASKPAPITIEPFRVDPVAAEQIRQRWTDQMLAKHEPGTWAPLKYSVSDEDLALLGLPSKKILLSRRYPEPTMVTRDGTFTRVQLTTAGNKGGNKTGNGKGGGGGGNDGGGTSLGPTVATVAGAGWFGIRPGALLLLMSGGGIGWCSMAHVYGTAGAYDISTAGHCGKTGDTATVIAAFGNQNGALNPILLDFGTFASSHDNGLGDDYALIDIKAPWQSLVTPTMAVWGGPRGSYTKVGALASVSFGRNLIPTVTTNPDPTLAQTLVHYGHGLGAHTLVTSIAVSAPGGTPRAGEGIQWASSYFLFNGYIAPGDSGSGANVIVGDTPGTSNMEAAGIITHIWIDPLMRDGIGLMGGTRVTKLGTPANGQIVPYPVPVTGLP